MIEYLETYDGILPNLPRSYGRICCICGRESTNFRDGTPIWYRYKDENGNHTGEWQCHRCHGRKKVKKIFRFKCRLCGTENTRLSNGKPIWVKDIDINRKFSGYYLCYSCAYEYNRPICGHTNRIYKIYDTNGVWTGKRRCRICDD